MAAIDVGLEFLLQIIGELEVNRRALNGDNESKQAIIVDLEQQLIAYKNAAPEPTPIVAEVIEDVGD